MRPRWSALYVGLVLAVPAQASAADPLVSGYAGPGGGDQAILGSSVTPGAGSKSTSGPGAGSSAGGGTQAPLALPAPTALTKTPQPQASAPAANATRPKRAPRAVAQKPADAARPSRTRPAVPALATTRVDYPARGAGASDGSGTLALEVVLGILGLIAVGVGTARLSGGGGRTSPA